MKNTIPYHIKDFFWLSNCTDVSKQLETVAGHLQCACGSDKFFLFSEKWIQSQESKAAEKAINALYEKYKKDPKYPIGDGNHFAQGIYSSDRPNDRVYISYHERNGKKIILEDITELARDFLSSEQIPTLILAVCSQCNKEIEVFNSSKHGYDGLICENKREYNTIPRKKISKCRKCSSEERILHIEFHYEDLESVKEDLGDEVDITNAFDWITIDLECANCKKLQKGYLDLETM